jgi:asparagine synthase (glutamine-hydrolysing)
LTGRSAFVAFAGRGVTADPASNGFHGELAPEATALSLVKRPEASASVAEGSGCRVVLDGMLYNRKELGSEGSADAQVVLEAYLRWGEGLMPRLRGEFALVIADSRDDTVFGVRDPVGTYPLFYAARADGSIAFSPSLDELTRQPGVSSWVNRVAIVDQFCGRWPDPGETYYENIRRVPPGRVVRFNGGRRSEWRYWNPARPDSLDGSVDEQVEQFDALFSTSVERCLAHGPAAIFLSGGLDSVSVAAVATDLTRSSGELDPLALSLVFPGAVENEEPIQRGVAEQLGLEQVIVPFQEAVGSESLLRASLGVAASWPSPFGNIWHPAYRTLALAGAERGRKVILTGSGGDEWLVAGPDLASDLIRKGDVRGLVRYWKDLNQSLQMPKLASLRVLLWRYGLRSVLAGQGERFAPFALNAYRRRRQRELTPDWVAPDPELRKQVLSRAYEWVTAKRSQRSFYERDAELSLEHVLVSNEMEDFYESGRRYGVEFRTPYWDADLVDFLYHVPWELLNDGGRQKGLVRRMLAQRFPDLGFERHKKVLATNFFAQVMATEGPAVWKEMGGATALADIGVVARPSVDSLVERACSTREARAVSLVWYLMTMEIWVRSRLASGGR